MKQKVWSHLGMAVLVAALSLACGGDSPLPTSPSGASGLPSDANPDGSTLKATPPTPLSPTNDVRLDDQTPVFRFANAEGRFVSASFDHQIQLLDQGGQAVYSVVVGPGAGETTHPYPGRLPVNTPYTWRARALQGSAAGPWSAPAGFITVDRPIVTPETMEAYLHQFAQGSPEWTACTGGSGTACFRFVWDAAQSLNPSCDPSSWGLLSKNPGEWQCTRSQCGSLGGQGFGEDILTYGGWSPIGAWDIIIGAGAPGASLSASYIAHRDRRVGNNWACPW